MNKNKAHRKAKAKPLKKGCGTCFARKLSPETYSCVLPCRGCDKYSRWKEIICEKN